MQARAKPSVIAAARSFLFLPADRLERLPKALGSGAHAVILDLEDGVAPEHKPLARRALATQWTGWSDAMRARLSLRISGTQQEWHAADVELARKLQGLAAVMLAKTEAPADLARLAAALPAIGLVPLIESAEGLAALELISRCKGVARLAFGHLDFQADLGMACGPDETELGSVRMALVLASRRAGLPAPVDGVTTNLDDCSQQLERHCQQARRFGFGGKLCIHPSQVEIVNRCLGPSLDERAWARRVLAAAASHGGGAFCFEGSMVDAPVLARALHIQSDEERERT